MAHSPVWHILDRLFSGSDRGLAIPAKATSIDSASLAIQNLDRSDPPGYVPGGVPRMEAFNRNIFFLGPEPCMPAIPVVCTLTGFDLATTPIHWRLQVQHTLCRFRNAGNYQYGSACNTLHREWRGQSSCASFTLFSPPDSACSCTYNDSSRVLGGHALLEVAVQTAKGILLDYVHLRIAGTNPSVDDICNHLRSQLDVCDPNILFMLQALVRHESCSRQFSQPAQTSARMTFTSPYHNFDPSQPNCAVDFDWPADPPDFPLASFDSGVGISQFTAVGNQQITPDIAWDWRENLRQAVNLFLLKLQHHFAPGLSWIEWALKAWAAYNGSGPQTLRYALELANTPEGRKISTEVVPVPPAIVLLPPLPSLPPPESWLLP